MSLQDGDNFILKHWPVLACIGGILITWGVFSNRLTTLEAETLVLKTQQEKTEDTLSDVKGGIIRIETSLDFIRKEISN